LNLLDSGVRRNDEFLGFLTFCEIIKIGGKRMRGDQLTGELSILWAIEANPDGFAGTATSQVEETAKRTIHFDLEAPPGIWFFPVY
jgi:hypothetical protein